MTIEEVMQLVKGLEGTAVDIAKGWTPGEWLDKEESDLRAAILALVAQARDDALEEAAKVCEDSYDPQWFTADEMARNQAAGMCAQRIRARIAARAEGGKHEN